MTATDVVGEDAAAKAHEEAEQQALDAAVALAVEEREQRLVAVEAEAAAWIQQRAERDKIVPAEERTARMVCPAGHYLCLQQRRGKCSKCGRRLQKSAQSVGCSGVCFFTVCTGCAMQVCGEDAVDRLQMAASLRISGLVEEYIGVMALGSEHAYRVCQWL